VRGSGLEPTTAASCELGCMGFMNAALGVRFLPDLLVAFFRAVVFLAGFRALFLADFLAAFFLVAIACLPSDCEDLACLDTAELP
jgi:hypothetical protein